MADHDRELLSGPLMGNIVTDATYMSGLTAHQLMQSSKTLVSDVMHGH